MAAAVLGIRSPSDYLLEETRAVPSYGTLLIMGFALMGLPAHYDRSWWPEGCIRQGLSLVPESLPGWDDDRVTFNQLSPSTGSRVILQTMRLRYLEGSEISKI